MENQRYIFYTLIVLAIMAVNIVVIILYKRKVAARSRNVQIEEFKKKLIIFMAVSEAEERERERIARNLHDEINLMLAVHKQVLEKHANNIENNTFDINDYYDEIGNIEKIREAVTTCATNLVPAFLLKNGLVTTLEDYIRRINQAGKLKARCYVLSEEGISALLGKQEELNIYRICLEVINNLLKHASPTVLTIKILQSKNNLLLQIDHDGKKIKDVDIEGLAKMKNGLGLNSIRARCLFLKATISYSDVVSDPAISLLIPLSPLTP